MVDTFIYLRMLTTMWTGTPGGEDSWARVLAAKISRPAIAITYSANYFFTASSLSFWCSRFSPTFQGKSATSWVSISLWEALQHLFVRSPHLRPPCPSCRRAMEAGLTGHVWSMKGYPIQYELGVSA